MYSSSAFRIASATESPSALAIPASSSAMPVGSRRHVVLLVTGSGLQFVVDDCCSRRQEEIAHRVQDHACGDVSLLFFQAEDGIRDYFIEVTQCINYHHL